MQTGSFERVTRLAGETLRDCSFNLTNGGRSSEVDLQEFRLPSSLGNWGTLEVELEGSIAEE